MKQRSPAAPSASNLSNRKPLGCCIALSLPGCQRGQLPSSIYSAVMPCGYAVQRVVYVINIAYHAKALCGGRLLPGGRCFRQPQARHAAQSSSARNNGKNAGPLHSSAVRLRLAPRRRMPEAQGGAFKQLQSRSEAVVQLLLLLVVLAVPAHRTEPGHLSRSACFFQTAPQLP